MVYGSNNVKKHALKMKKKWKLGITQCFGVSWEKNKRPAINPDIE